MRKVFERFKNLRKKLTNLSYIDKKSDAKKNINWLTPNHCLALFL